MNRPTLMTRFIGRPLVAAVLFIALAALVAGWVYGPVPWWLGLAAVCSLGTVRKAARNVRAYRQWSADWIAMGPPGPAPPEPAAKPSSRSRKPSPSRVGLVVAAVSVVVIPILMASLGADEEARRTGLGLLWLGMALYLLFKLMAKLYRAARRRSKSVGAGATGDGAPDVVQWALPPASSSPSRADAMHNVPEYSARLIDSE